MGITVHMDYNFILDGVEYVGIGQEWGETEKKSDIKEIKKDVYNSRLNAYCQAFNLSADEVGEDTTYFQEFKRSKFTRLEIY